MIVYIYLISFTIINSFLLYYKKLLYTLKSIEHFYNTVNSFDEVLDNLCSTTASDGKNQYDNGSCVVSNCPLETCYRTSGSSLVPETSKQDLYNGECVSKQQTKKNVYNCTPYQEPSPPPPPPPSTYVVPQTYEERTYGQQPQVVAMTPVAAPPVYSQPVYSQPVYSSSPQVTQESVTIVRDTTPVTATARFVLAPSSEPEKPDYFKDNYAEIKDCKENEYWNHDNQQCAECSSDYILKNRRAVVSNMACEKKMTDCNKTKCYTSDCKIVYKNKVLNEEKNVCELPPDCDLSCKKTLICPANPRIPCVHPVDKTFQRYKYNDACELESVVDPGKTITSCERCGRYTKPDGTVVNQQLRRENGVVICKEI